MRTTLGIAIAVVALFGIAGSAMPSFAETYIVKELNVGPNGEPDVFLPDLLRIQPGDSVTFQANDSGHDVRSIENDIPAGAQPFQGPINKTFTVIFTIPGVYAYKCQPHLSFGMVGMIVVGEPTNLNQLSFEGLPRRAHDRLVSLAAQVRNSSQSEH